MKRVERKTINDIYDAIKSEETVLGFDEERGVGVIALLEHRKEQTQLMPVAEIKGTLVIPIVVNE